MTMDPIERALREGPPDEPVYAPGRFARTSPSGWRRLVLVPVIAVAVAVGAMAGASLSARRDGAGDQPRSEAIARALPGTWISDELTFQAWTDGLIARGFSIGEISAFLEHDPFSRTVQYRLTFSENTLTVEAIYDGAAPIGLGGGPYQVLEDARLSYRDAPQNSAPGAGCLVTVSPDVDATRLVTQVSDLTGCDPEEVLAMAVFFDLAPYMRTLP